MSDRPMTPLHKITLGVSLIMARIAGFAILGSALMIAAEVVARKQFGVTLVGADEIAGYVLAISVTWGASLAIVRRAHVRIDILHAQAPRALAAAMDVLALVAMLVFTCLLGWFATRLLATNIRFGAVSNTGMETPLWIPQLLWVAGIWVFAIVTIALILLTLTALARRDFEHARALAGVRGALEEAKDEAGAQGGRD